MTITCYLVPYGSKTVMIVYGPPPERKELMRKVGTDRWHPLSEKDYDRKYPAYTIVTVDGIEEVFEKRQPGDILYITDDPKVTSLNKRK